PLFDYEAPDEGRRQHRALPLTLTLSRRERGPEQNQRYSDQPVPNVLVLRAALSHSDAASGSMAPSSWRNRVFSAAASLAPRPSTARSSTALAAEIRCSATALPCSVNSYSTLSA